MSGPTGAGKEYVANAIHVVSERPGKIIAINCGAIPEQLLESELFGYERGAFSGADKQHKGRIEQSDQGTLFLDEIGDITTEMQVKILRVLESKKITRLGGKEEIALDFRLICASHKDLKKLIREKKFREDLYYRINIFPLNVPALKDRSEDILCYIEKMVEDWRLRHAGKQAVEFDESFKIAAVQYEWPGNLRELRNVVERASIIYSGKVLSDNMFWGGLVSQTDKLDAKISIEDRKSSNTDFEDELANIDFSVKDTGVSNKKLSGFGLTDVQSELLKEYLTGSNAIDLKNFLGELENFLIGYSLKLNNYNVKKTSLFLGMNRTTLIAKLKKIESD